MPGTPLSAPREVRARWYLQVDKYGKSVVEVCTIFGITKKTYHKWYNRDHGLVSRKFQNRKDHPSLKLTPRIRVAVYDAKLKYNYGPKKMVLYIKKKCGVKLSSTILYRYFKRKRLIRKPQKKQPWYTPMKKRFRSNRPGQNVQLDTKYVPGCDQTWEYQFRFTDTFTNMQYAINCFDKSAASSLRALAKAIRYFPFAITGIQTDNGSEFRGLFAYQLKKDGVAHRFIPKRSAPWNGKVERANRSIDDEYYLNVTKPWQNIGAYTHWYNYERPHLGKTMHGRTPYEKFVQFTQRHQMSNP